MKVLQNFGDLRRTILVSSGCVGSEHTLSRGLEGAFAKLSTQIKQTMKFRPLTFTQRTGHHHAVNARVNEREFPKSRSQRGFFALKHPPLL